MAQTLVSLLVHIVFSTKNRQPFITSEIEQELFSYVGGILSNNESRLIAAGGTADHVHLLISQSKNVALSSLVKDVKKDSSSWIKTKGSQFRRFHWQEDMERSHLAKHNFPTSGNMSRRRKNITASAHFKRSLFRFLRNTRSPTTSAICGNESDPFRVDDKRGDVFPWAMPTAIKLHACSVHRRKLVS